MPIYLVYHEESMILVAAFKQHYHAHAFIQTLGEGYYIAETNDKWDVLAL